MNKEKKRIYILIFSCILFYSYPVCAMGYEEISPIKTIFKLFFYIIVLITFLFFTLYGTRLIAKNFKGINSSKYITLLDMINIPGGSKIVLAKISDKIYILLLSDKKASIIDTIREEEFPSIDDNFDNHLNRFLRNKNTNKKIKEMFNIFDVNKDKEEN